MAEIRPFRAVRPVPELAAKVAALPYDVMSSEEARQMVEHIHPEGLHAANPMAIADQLVRAALQGD